MLVHFPPVIVTVHCLKKQADLEQTYILFKQASSYSTEYTKAQKDLALFCCAILYIWYVVNEYKLG